MGLFSNLKQEADFEKNEDRLGGGGFVVPTDIYNAIIKIAYAGKSDKGAQFVDFTFKLDDGTKEGKDYKERFYVTNAKGENFYKTKTDKKAALPSFVVVNDICLASSDKELFEQDTEDKVINIYDYDAKKEVPTSVPVLIDLINQPVSLAIFKNLENKSEKNDAGGYDDTAETHDTNSVEKAFHTETKLTMNEARDGKPATFWDSWKEKYADQETPYVRDKRTVKGDAPKSGRPGRSGSAPASGDAPARKSLFGK